MRSGRGRTVCPAHWLAFAQAFQGAAVALGERTAAIERTRAFRAGLQARIAAQRERIETAEEVDAPDTVRRTLREAVSALNRHLELEHARLLEVLERVVDDFDHAEENEDRFVVLAFGEVNSGKSALANHVAGLDFDLSPYVEGSECFVNDDRVDRLEERATECTREYQGFRRPGLLWIDCPGVLSATGSNAQTARRLVSRADFVVFVTPSDAPFRNSELREVQEIIRQSGNHRLQRCFVMTKNDRLVIDIDLVTGEEVRRVEPKPPVDQKAQREWAKEQLSQAESSFQPVAVSVYVARDRLGREWRTGRPRRAPAQGWDAQYSDSGMPALFRALAATMKDHGASLKAEWPEKRRAALQREVGAASERVLARVDGLLGELTRQRRELADAMQHAADDAAELAASHVRPCLVACGALRDAGLDAGGAARDLQHHLETQVRAAIERGARDAFVRVDRQIGEALTNLAAETTFDLEIKRRTRTETFQSSVKGRAIGKGVGGLGGGMGGAAAGAALGNVVPIIGPIVGFFLGGFLGSLGGGAGGAYVGGKVFTETVTVNVEAGSNLDEVVVATGQMMAARARDVVAQLHGLLDEAVLAPLDAQARRMRDDVLQWRDL